MPMTAVKKPTSPRKVKSAPVKRPLDIEEAIVLLRQAVRPYPNAAPCELEVLLCFHGVGPKCANLALGIACGQSSIGVDIHVHRVTNRWGYVQTRTPEKTMAALQEKLPKEYWVEINALLVPFGKHICTPIGPKCSTCPLLDMCAQRGVSTSR